MRYWLRGFLGDGIPSSTRSIRVERLKVAAERLQLFRRQFASVKDRLFGHGVIFVTRPNTGATARIALNQIP